MRRKISIIVLSIVMAAFSGCGTNKSQKTANHQIQGGTSENSNIIAPSSEPVELEKGLSAVQFEGDYGFDRFLEQGGAVSDSEVIQFLAQQIAGENIVPNAITNIFGCSTLSVKSPENEMLFGRNFDWNKCDAIIVMARPDNAYHSISTVNTNFISSGLRGLYSKLPPEAKTIAALYAPLDGMNEKGLCVSVNMIQDTEDINQNTSLPDITTTTAIRLLLDKAANTEEALALLQQYDFHASMGMSIHFAIADAIGRSIAVEYIGNERQVIDTPVVTNFYLSPGNNYGIGTNQSHERYHILMERLSDAPNMTMENVRDALDSVSKDNFNEFESTEWSVVYNQSTREVRYYHREDYTNSYVFYVE